MNLCCRGSVDGSVDIDRWPVDYVWTHLNRGPPGEGASQFGNLCSTLSTFSEAEFVTYVTFVTCTEDHYNTSHVDIIFITNCLAFCSDMRSKSQHRNRVIRWIPSDSLNIFCNFCTP
ncbi:hypothetical protein M8J77_015103 [Diaphorina citri]|nr:hypothetical protein M8J77_015103 [Diaphorina citri]